MLRNGVSIPSFWGIKHHPFFFTKVPLKSANRPSSPFLGNPPLYIYIFCEPLPQPIPLNEPP